MSERVWCETCGRKNNEINLYLKHLRQVAKQRAVNENRTYAIWFDNEDKKHYARSFDEAKADSSITIFEIISKYP